MQFDRQSSSSFLRRYLEHVDWFSIGPSGRLRVDDLQDEVREARRRERATNAQLSQEFVASLNTGRGLPAEKWRERRLRGERLATQTQAIASILERQGVSTSPSSCVTAIGLVTGEAEQLNQYRSICFLPSVAQRDRRPVLQELRYLRKTHRHHREFLRMAVVTNGQRVAVGGDLRGRIRELSRAISKTAKWAKDRWQIDIICRCTEFTVDQKDWSFHPHANVLFTPTRKLTQREWEQFLKEARQHLGGWWWKDCGRLENAEEAIKYCVKPNDLDAFINDHEGLGAQALKWLFEQTFGLKMIQPMGSFKDWRREALTETVFRYVDEVGATHEAPKIDELPAGALSAAKKIKRQTRKVVSVERASGASLELCTVRRRKSAMRQGADRRVDDKDKPPRENVLLGITMPQRRFSPYAEPCALIMNYTKSPSSAYGFDTLDELEIARESVSVVWRMNGGPDPAVAIAVGRGQAAAAQGEAGKVRPFIVHTRSSTVRTKNQLQLSCVDPPANETHAPLSRAGNQ